MTFVELLYFSSSALKYFSSNPTYPELALDTPERLAGSCIVGLTILAQIGLIKSEATGPNAYARQMAVLRRSQSVTVTMLTLSLGLASYALYRNFGSTHNANLGDGITFLSRTEIAVLGVVSLFQSVTLLTAMLLGIRSSTARTALGKALCAVGFASLLALSSRLLQSRLHLCMLILAALFSFEATRFAARARRVAHYVLLLSPVLGLLSGGVALQAVGRATTDGLEAWVDEVAVRVDVSDYAVACLRVPPADGIIRSAIVNATPAVLFPAKYEYMTGEALLVAGRDYPDTLASSGVRAFGAAGFIGLPLLFAVLLRSAGRALRRCCRTHGAITLAVLCMSCFYIELGWAEMFLAMRALLVALACIVPLVIIGELFDGQRSTERRYNADCGCTSC
jgi:hypothetical protein